MITKLKPEFERWFYLINFWKLFCTNNRSSYVYLFISRRCNKFNKSLYAYSYSTFKCVVNLFLNFFSRNLEITYTAITFSPSNYMVKYQVGGHLKIAILQYNFSFQCTLGHIFWIQKSTPPVVETFIQV